MSIIFFHRFTNHPSRCGVLRGVNGFDKCTRGGWSRCAKSFNRRPISAEKSFDIHFCCRYLDSSIGNGRQTESSNKLIMLITFFCLLDILVAIDSAARDNVLLLQKVSCLQHVPHRKHSRRGRRKADKVAEPLTKKKRERTKGLCVTQDKKMRGSTKTRNSSYRPGMKSAGFLDSNLISKRRESFRRKNDAFQFYFQNATWTGRSI